MKAKRIKVFGLIILLVILTYFSYTKLNRFIKIDSCLDKGGSWNYNLEKCECLQDTEIDSENINLK